MKADVPHLKVWHILKAFTEETEMQKNMQLNGASQEKLNRDSNARYQKIGL